jgi:hypothetical protein
MYQNMFSYARLKIVTRCEHCDVDAYYRLTIEDFNNTDSYNLDLCIKCVRREDNKVIEYFPSIKSLRIEPISLVLIATSTT